MRWFLCFALKQYVNEDFDGELRILIAEAFGYFKPFAECDHLNVEKPSRRRWLA
jgi:hypothetical protein